MPQHRLFTDAALAHFRKFTAQDAADRTRTPLKPEGACDVVHPAIRRAMDAAGGTLDPDTVNLILKLVSEVHGEDATGALMKTLHQKYPGSCGEMPGEDETGEDWPRDRVRRP